MHKRRWRNFWEDDGNDRVRTHRLRRFWRRIPTQLQTHTHALSFRFRFPLLSPKGKHIKRNTRYSQKNNKDQ